MKKVFLCLVLALAGCTTAGSSVVSETSSVVEEEVTSEVPEEETVQNNSLSVNGTQLVDQNGNAIQLRGISTHGIGWFPQYVNADLFQYFHDEWQMNVIRLAMYTAESNGYCTDGDQEALKDLVRKGIQYAKEAGMYAIVDWHILSDNNPNMHVEEAKEFFQEIAADYDHVLYEICNEPNGNTSWQDIKTYAEQIIPVIRSKDPDSIILVGTPNWSQYVNEAADDPIKGYENIMYTLHFYAATHKDDLRQKLQYALGKGLPVFVSEYGICDASGNGFIDSEEAEKWVSLLDREKISYIMWNLSNKDESSSILKPSCTNVTNPAVSDLSASGQWLYELLTNHKPVEEHTDKTEDIQEESESVLTWNIRDTWEEEGETVSLYDFTIENLSNDPTEGWQIKIQFSEDFDIKDSWNVEYEVQDKELFLTPVEYNREITAKGSVKDIGIIVKGGGKSDVRLDEPYDN
ncbi:MAG: cellulase family glycosylhydrolase [Solobacterium sp.]|nr:cellulase family glycosylhydrolase [Solobacterium sp.]